MLFSRSDYNYYLKTGYLVSAPQPPEMEEEQDTEAKTQAVTVDTDTQQGLLVGYDYLDVQETGTAKSVDSVIGVPDCEVLEGEGPYDPEAIFSDEQESVGVAAFALATDDGSEAVGVKNSAMIKQMLPGSLENEYVSPPLHTVQPLIIPAAAEQLGKKVGAVYEDAHGNIKLSYTVR